VADEYLDLAEEYQCATQAAMRGHVFNILQDITEKQVDIREALATAKTIEQFRAHVAELHKREADGTTVLAVKLSEKRQRKVDARARRQEEVETAYSIAEQGMGSLFGDEDDY
jgi:hypothetical protein